MKQLEEYRKEFAITENYAFFNNAAVSAPPGRVVSAVENLFRQFGREGLTRYPQWMGTVDHTRSLFAKLINASPSEIAFTGNTSDGLSAIAAGIDWKSGDKILVPFPDFPSNVYPWLNLERKGVEIYFLQRRNGRFDAVDISAVLRPGTRLIALSSTDFSTGFTCDMEEIGDFCRRHGILLCVDAIQSLGAVPFDVKKYGISFLACGGHKWLLSTMGSGALYVSTEVNDLVHPARVGWRSVQDEENFYTLDLRLKEDARRFETGTLNIAGITALGASLELLLEIGIDRIFERLLSLNDIIAAGLKKRDFEVVSPKEREHRSGILSFLPNDAEGLFRYCLNSSVLVSRRGNALRLSPHFYNNEADVERFFEVLDEYTRNGNNPG